MTRQDSAFYTDDNSPQTVWQDRAVDYYVVRNGKMRIHARLNNESEPVVIRYSDQLISYGVDSDEKLAALEGNPDFDWVNNSWFEVWGVDNEEDIDNVYDTLDEAISAARAMNEEVTK